MKLITSSGFMILIASGLMFLSAGVCANEYKVGDQLAPYTLQDNHGHSHTMSSGTEVILLSFDMKKSKAIHNWLAEKEPDYLAQENTEYVADITPMPAIITKLFAGPKMAKYPFQILLANDKDFAPQFPKKEDKITVLVVDKDRTITHIMYFNDMDEVNGLISNPSK